MSAEGTISLVELWQSRLCRQSLQLQVTTWFTFSNSSVFILLLGWKCDLDIQIHCYNFRFILSSLIVSQRHSLLLNAAFHTIRAVSFCWWVTFKTSSFMWLEKNVQILSWSRHSLWAKNLDHSRAWNGIFKRFLTLLQIRENNTYVGVHIKDCFQRMCKGQFMQLVGISSCACYQCAIHICKFRTSRLRL